MAEKKGYGQFCPVAQAAEVLAERWTPLVIRELCCGSTRFNDLQRGVPRMSPSLLSRRLKELEHAGIVAITPTPGGKGSEYRLTPAGEALFPVIEQMGNWAVDWFRDDLTSDANLDPNLLMWDVRRRVLEFGERPERRRVVKFQFSGGPVSHRLYWLILDPDEADLCFRDPGLEIDLHVRGHLRVVTRLWLGHLRIDTVLSDGSLALDGTPAAVKAFRKWLALSHHANRAA
jgi:DNA-binding HxlR family transcriptional regulator